MNLKHHIGKRLYVDFDNGNIKTTSCIHYERYFPGLPNVDPDEEPGCVEKLMNLSQLWELNLLESICANIQNEEPHLNPSLAVSHNTEMGERLTSDFLHTNKWTDVSFDVEGNWQDLCISTYNKRETILKYSYRHIWYLQMIGYIMACRSCSFVCRLHHLIIITMQTYLKALNY